MTPVAGDGLHHLVPEARAAALLPDAERLSLLRTERWWIAHDRAQAALGRLDALLRDGPGQIRPPNILLAGPTNNGKSWIIERFVRSHATPGGEDAECLPVVAMQMPTEPTVTRFYAALLAHLGAPVPRGGPSARKPEMEQLALRVLRDVGAAFSVSRMLSFDSVRLRLEREQGLTFLEFNYSVLQSYDFRELHRRHGVRLQLGGSDQWGNIVSGVELTRRTDGVQVFGLTTPLLTTASGAKMGKTARGAVWLTADRLGPYDYWQFWRNTEDADVGRFLRLFTDLPLDEIARLDALGGAEINEAKKRLATEATALAHGPAAAAAAAETARRTCTSTSTGNSGCSSSRATTMTCSHVVPMKPLRTTVNRAPGRNTVSRPVRWRFISAIGSS